MDFQIVIPYLQFPWSLHDLIESMGEITCPILVVDNSPNSDTKNLHNGNQLDREDYQEFIEYVYYPQNYGVPGSWNLGVAKGAEWTLILSTSVRFTKPLQQVLDQIPGQARDKGAIYEGYHMVTIHRKVFETIGLFDENFYPGYNEDSDWGRRLDLAGISFDSFYDAGNTTIGSGLHKRSGDWSWDDTSPLRTGRVEDYFAHKWGGHPARFEKPFNNPENGLDYWPKVHH
jgi:hypothetical protein